MFITIKRNKSTDVIISAEVTTIGGLLDTLINMGVKKPFKKAKNVIKNVQRVTFNNGDHTLEITPLEKGYTLLAREWSDGVIRVYTTHGYSIREIMADFRLSDFHFNDINIGAEEKYFFGDNVHITNGDLYEITITRIN